MPLVTYSQVLGIKIRIFSFEEEEDFIQSPQCPSWMHAVTTVWAKALQSCPTLCNPVDCSLPGSSVHWDSPGKNTGGGCCALLQGNFPIQGGCVQSPQFPSPFADAPVEKEGELACLLPLVPQHIFSDFSQVSAVWKLVLLTLSSTQDTCSTPSSQM